MTAPVASRCSVLLVVVGLCLSTAWATPASAGPVRDTLQSREVLQSRESVAKDDLRNLAVAEEIYFTDHGRYASISQLQKDGQQVTVSRGVTLSVVWYTAKTWCLSAAFSSRLGRSRTIFVDSAVGNYADTGCATKRPRTAKAGGSIKGAPPLLPTG